MKWATRLCAKASMKWSTGRPLHACRCAAPVDKSNIYLFTSQNALSVHVHVPVHFIILSHLKALNMSHLLFALLYLPKEQKATGPNDQQNQDTTSPELPCSWRMNCLLNCQMAIQARRRSPFPKAIFFFSIPQRNVVRSTASVHETLWLAIIVPRTRVEGLFSSVSIYGWVGVTSLPV